MGIPMAAVAKLHPLQEVWQRSSEARVTGAAEAAMDHTGVFASNTSTLPITGLAEASSRPEKFIGLHFFSPVHRMQLVEIIVGAKTDDETLAKAFDYVLAIGKVPIVVNDSRGFYTSRVFSTWSASTIRAWPSEVSAAQSMPT